MLSSSSSLLAPGLQAAAWLRQSVAIDFKDFKLRHITVNTSEGYAQCCHSFVTARYLNPILLSWFYSWGGSYHIWQQEVYWISSAQHLHGLLCCAWQIVVRVWSAVFQMQLGDIHPQRTPIWAQLRRRFEISDWYGRLTWGKVLEYIPAPYRKLWAQLPKIVRAEKCHFGNWRQRTVNLLPLYSCPYTWLPHTQP